jgi:hypothetical protein
MPDGRKVCRTGSYDGILISTQVERFRVQRSGLKNTQPTYKEGGGSKLE